MELNQKSNIKEKEINKNVRYFSTFVPFRLPLIPRRKSSNKRIVKITDNSLVQQQKFIYKIRQKTENPENGEQSC